VGPLKLIIQIPCHNEAAALPVTLGSLPRTVPGIDTVEWLVVDDGSRDDTEKIAREMGVEHIVVLPKRQGLAKAFMAGINRALEEGADVIVNTDADNQYCADDIGALVKPFLNGTADFVVGERPISTIQHFSFLKKTLQKIGSWVVRTVSHTDIPDAPSGFRAMSRSCAKQLNVFSDYTYTLETIIQAGQKGMAITSVPVRVNRELRKSRLIKSVPGYIIRSAITILRIFVVYQPFKFFMALGIVLLLLGLGLGLRFLYFYFILLAGGGHVQSLIFASILLGMGFQTCLIAFVADLLSVNRKLLELIKVKNDYKVNR
jgi:glycosyltransferase involved in cell wall biosynthesis